MDEQNAESLDLPPSYVEAIAIGSEMPPEIFHESESINVHRETSSQQNQSSQLQRSTNLDRPQERIESESANVHTETSSQQNQSSRLHRPTHLDRPQERIESESANVHTGTSSHQNQSSRLHRPTHLDRPHVHSNETAHNVQNRANLRQYNRLRQYRLTRVPVSENTSLNRTNIVQHTSHSGPQRPIIHGSIDPATIARLTSLSSTCPNCGNHTILKAYAIPNVKTHLCAIFLLVLGCFVCSCIPYFLDCCKTAHVYCSECNYYLGTYDGFTGKRTYSDRYF